MVLKLKSNYNNVKNQVNLKNQKKLEKKIQQACGAQEVLQFVYNEDSPNGIGEFVKEWPSQKAARKVYGSGVGGVIRGTSKFCKGYKFIWKKDYNNLAN